MAAVERAAVGSEVAVAASAEVDQAEDAVRDLTAEELSAFVDYVRGHKGCSVQEACKAVGVRRRDVRALRKADSEFAEDYATARGYGHEQLLGAAVEEAVIGVEEYVVSAGKIVEGEDGKPLKRRVRNDRVLIWLLNGMTEEGKSMMAGKLGIEISGPDGGPIKVQSGVSLESVAQVLLNAGVDLGALADRHNEIQGELVSETDDPTDDEDDGSAGVLAKV